MAAVAACGDDEKGPPTEVEVETRFERGREVFTESGCLGCHRMKGQGNIGPGPDLSRIGVRLDRAAIERSLVKPKTPMPSYSVLRRERPADFRELVNFLADLR